MNSMVVGVLALSLSNFVLLLLNLMLRSKITELRQELKRREEWHQRALNKFQQRI